jgi:uncharacterized membrane protein YozB (DUF420 family)
MKGFLGTWAGFGADLNLAIQVAMGLVLVAGAFLARAKRFTAHAICQATVLLLNLLMIFFVMWPSFHARVLPKVPQRLHRTFYAVSTVHGVLGASAELFGLYILLVAGTSLVPQALRFRRWKLWMRIELALWWVVLSSGLATYYIWYAASPRR